MVLGFAADNGLFELLGQTTFLGFISPDILFCFTAIIIAFMMSKEIKRKTMGIVPAGLVAIGLGFIPGFLGLVLLLISGAYSAVYLVTGDGFNEYELKTDSGN